MLLKVDHKSGVLAVALDTYVALVWFYLEMVVLVSGQVALSFEGCTTTGLIAHVGSLLCLLNIRNGKVFLHEFLSGLLACLTICNSSGSGKKGSTDPII